MGTSSVSGVYYPTDYNADADLPVLLKPMADSAAKHGHKHTVADTTGLATELSKKAPLTHSHADLVPRSYIQAGVVAIKVSNSTVGAATISYSGFPSKPVLICTPGSDSAFWVRISSATSTKATVKVQFPSKVSKTVYVNWLAVHRSV